MLNIAQETELLSFVSDLRDFLNEEFDENAPEDHNGDGAYYFREAMFDYRRQLNEIFGEHFND